MNLRLGMKQKLVIILKINLISNGDKLLIYFPKCGKKYSKTVKVIAQI